MRRVVLDTVVFVRALINPKSRSGRLLFQHADSFTLIFSQATAQELLEVIRRSELTRKYQGLANFNLRRVIDLLAQAEAVEIGVPPRMVRDPADDIFVAQALAGSADYIVSEDKDLLSLGESAGVPVLTTEAFLAIL